MLTIHPPAFVETGSCGIKYVRGQPSRETPGATLAEVQDKYTPVFELPLLNVQRYIGEVKNSWNKLDENQRNLVRESINEMNGKENYQMTLNQQDEACIRSLLDNVEKFKILLDIISKPSEEDKTKYEINDEKLGEHRKILRNWAKDNFIEANSNWKSGLLLALLIFLVLLLCVNLYISFKQS